MSYYADLFLRPKQATQFALQNPSVIRGVFMVILGSVAGVLASLLFAGTIFWDVLLSSFLGDVLRWVVGGIFLLLIGMFFKHIPLNGQTFSQTLSLLAQLNFYGFFLFMTVGIILPAIAIPGLLQASQDYNKGLIGEEEFNQAIFDSLSDINTLSLLALPFILLAFIFLLYGVYALYLGVHHFLTITVFKSVIVMILLAFVQGAVLFLLP